MMDGFKHKGILYLEKKDYMMLDFFFWEMCHLDVELHYYWCVAKIKMR